MRLTKAKLLDCIRHLVGAECVSDCDYCKGTGFAPGYMSEDSCPECYGYGLVHTADSIEVIVRYRALLDRQEGE